MGVYWDSLANWARGLWRGLGLLTLLSGVMLGAALGGVGSVPAVWADDDDDIDELVVKLDVQTGVTIEDINAEYGTTTLNTLLASRGIYLIHVPEFPLGYVPEDGDDDDFEADDWEELLEVDARILYADPNFTSDIPESGGNFTWSWGGEDEEPRSTQYARATLALDAAHDQTTGAGTVVAVLDTGVQVNHPALSGNLTPARYDFIDDDDDPSDVGNGIDDDADGRIDEAVGHGTHVAGTVLLVAPDAVVMPVRVLDSDGRGAIFRVAEGILFAAENGAHVINLSLGASEESDLLEDIIGDVSAQSDVVFVAAAGNLGSSSPQYPADDEDVLAVSAVDETNLKPDFANFGKWIDVVAPGVGIYSTFPVDGYAYWTGTSMSTPMVAAQAALLRSLGSTASAGDVRALIRQTAQSVDAANPDYAGELGAGRVDIAGALQMLCGEFDCPASTPDEPVPGEPVPDDDPNPDDPSPGDDPAPGDDPDPDNEPVPDSEQDAACPCRVLLPGLWQGLR